MERAIPTLASWRIWVPAAVVAVAIFVLGAAPSAGLALAPWVLAAAVLWAWYSFKRWREALAFITVIGSFGAATLFFGRLAGSPAVLPALAGISAGIMLAEGLVRRRGLRDTPAGVFVTEASLVVFPLALFFWLASLLGFGLGFILPFGRVLVAAAAVTFFLSGLVLGTGRRDAIAALVAALIVAETLWAVSFWPMGALGGGAIAAAGATGVLALARDGIAGRLNPGRAAMTVAFAALSIGFIIGVSRWLLRP